MDGSSATNQAVQINAAGGVMLGLLLAMVVIFGGFSLVLGTEAEVGSKAYPAWADENVASASPYQAVPTAATPSPSLILANARR